MSGPAFQVDSAALDSHANTANHIGDELAAAAKAGNVVQTDTGAYATGEL